MKFCTDVWTRLKNGVYAPLEIGNIPEVEKSVLLIITTSRSNFLLRGIQRRMLKLSENLSWTTKFIVGQGLPQENPDIEKRLQGRFLKFLR